MSTVALAMTDKETKDQPFQIRGSLQTMLALRLIAPDDPAFFAALQSKISHAPEFYRDAPLVIDAGHLDSDPPVDLDGFCKRLRAMRLNPVGVQSGNEDWRKAGRKAGLAVFAAGGKPSDPPADGVPGRTSSNRSATVGTIITNPVRGGQQIHNDHGDLIVMTTVGDGAEVAAAGNIHIYGTLRGRAFAGTGGDEHAMIFCDSMDAQLLSIAGVHMLNEDIDPQLHKRRVRVFCNGTKLIMAPLP